MKTQRLIPLSLVVITVSLATSVGLSVAWYANGAYLRISNVDVSLMSDPQLGMALMKSDNLDDYHYGEFPYDELPKMKSGYSDEESDQESVINGFVPVSSMFSSDWIGKTDASGELLDPQFCSNYKRASLDEPDTYRKTKIATSGFYSVPLYLMCDRDMYVTVDETGTSIIPDNVTNSTTAKEMCEADKDYEYSQTLNDLNAIANSIRISIYDCESQKYWIIDPNKSEDPTYLAGPLDLDANHIFDFYADDANNAMKEYLFGEYDDSTPVHYKDSYGVQPVSEFNTFSANHLDGVQMVDMDYYIQNGLLKEEKTYTPHELNDIDMIAMTNHVPHRIVLSIYIEGWDRDNTSVSSQGSFFASIKFKLTRPNFSN